MIKVSKKDISREEWENRRKLSLGGSDVGTSMGLNTHKTPADLWIEKVGLLPLENISFQKKQIMFIGSLLEPFIANVLEYFDLDEPQKYLDNYADEKKVRIVEESEFTFYHERFSYLSGNIDRFITWDKKHADEKGIAEIKTIHSKEFSKFEVIPPAYFMQLEDYLFLTECRWGIVVFFIMDTREFKAFEFELDDGSIEMMVNETGEFWDRVKGAIKAAKEGMAFSEIRQTFEPYTPEHPAWMDYMKKTFIDDGKIMEGDQFLYDKIANLMQLKSTEKEIQNEAKEIEKAIKTSMLQQGASIIEMDGTELLTWRKYANGRQMFKPKLKGVF